MRRLKLVSLLAALFAMLVPALGDAQSSARTTQATLATVNAAATVNLNNGTTSCTTSVSGTWSGTLTAEGPSPAGTYVGIPTQPYGGGSASTTITANGLYQTPVAGLAVFRVRYSTVGSGAPVVAITCTTSSGGSSSSSGGGGGGGTYTAPPVQAVAPVASQTPFLVAPAPSGSPFPVAVTSGMFTAPPTQAVVPGPSQSPFLVAPAPSGSPFPVAIASGPYSMTTQSQTATPGSAIGTACTFFASPSALSAGAVAPCNVDQFDNQMVDVAAFIASLPTGTNSIGTVGLNAGTNNVGNVGIKKNTAVETTALLGASATYTGAWHDTGSGDNTTTVNAASYSSIGGSSSNGFQIQETNDSSGLTGNYTVNSTTVNSAAYGRLTAQVTARYWRIVYNNYTTAQTGTFEIAYTTSGVPFSSVDSNGNQKTSIFGANNANVNALSYAGDATSTSLVSLLTANINLGYNGTSYDRERTSQAVQGTGTGRLATSICDPTNAYCAQLDSQGNQRTIICGSTTANCLGTTFPETANNLATTYTLPVTAINESYNFLTGENVNIADAKSGGGSNLVSIPLSNPGGALATTLTSASPTACTPIETNVSGRLVSLVNASTTAQTVTLSLYNEGASPTCASADMIYSVVLIASDNRVLNIPVTAGLAYTLSGAATNNIIITRNYRELLREIGFKNVYAAMRALDREIGDRCFKTLTGRELCNTFVQ